MTTSTTPPDQPVPPIPPPPPTGGPVDDRRRATVTLLDAGVTLTLYFLGQLSVGFLAAGLAAVFGLRLSGVAWTGIAVVSTLAGLVLALGWLQLRGRLRDAVASAGRSPLLSIGIGISVGIVGGMAAYGINSLIGIFLAPEAPVEQQLLQDALGGGQALAVAVLIAVVIAPIAEELLFRGVLFRALRRRVGRWPAAVLSSLIFTGVHVEIVFSQPLALTGLFVFGVILAWSLDRFQHLIVPIVAHSVFNGISLVLVVLLDRLGFTV